MLLKLHKVARFYGPRLIFKDVTLEVFPGGVTLLAGANGAGKSTLLKIMAGLIPPSSGEVRTADDAPLVGYLGHQTFIYPDLTAAENLAFWAALYGRSLPDDAIAAALERVELAPFAAEKAKGFSRGMAQRLNLARVFLLAPDLLLLDEPGTGLDVRSTAILHREIEAARTNGAGVVWITHSLDADLARADHVAYLADKRLAYYGPAAAFHDEAAAALQNGTPQPLQNGLPQALQNGPPRTTQVPAVISDLPGSSAPPDSPGSPAPPESRRAGGGEPC